MNPEDQITPPEENSQIYNRFPILKNRSVLILGLFVVSIILIIPLILFIFSVLSSNENVTKNPVTKEPFKATAPFVPDQLVVQYKNEYTEEEALALKNKLDEIGVVSQEKVFDSEDPQLKNFYILKFKKGTNIQNVKKTLDSFDGIVSTDIQYVVGPQDVPNDPLYSDLWAAPKIDMPNAWNINHGARGVTVAVVDSGVDYTHPDLAANVIKGPNLNPTSGRSSNDPLDDFGHGTHVAGTIGAVGNNGIGVAGNSWNIGILGVKVGGTRGESNTTIIAQGITESANRGAKVINISMGTSGTALCDSIVQSAITAASNKGALIIVAAGNSNADASLYTPSSCNNVLVVGATDQTDRRASFSNYGASVDIGAPGVSILSTFPPGKNVGSTCGDSNYGTASDGYGYCNGTSMATPEVSGVAGLIFSANPNLTPAQVQSCILDNADPITTDRPVGGRRLNAFKAINACSGLPPITAAPTIANPGITTQPTQPVPTSATLQNMIYGVIFTDTNNNGTKDAGEPGYTNAQIITEGPAALTTTPDSNGNFQFTNITPGTYRVSAMINGVKVMTTEPRMLASQGTIFVNFRVGYIPPTQAPNEPTQAPISPTIVVPSVQTPTSAPASPTPTAKTYSCHMKSSGTSSKGSITIGDLVCTPN